MFNSNRRYRKVRIPYTRAYVSSPLCCINPARTRTLEAAVHQNRHAIIPDSASELEFLKYMFPNSTAYLCNG